MLPDPTGNVVVVATVTTGGLGEFAAGRITPAGGFDPTFGVGGRISFHFGAGTNDTVGGAFRDAAGNLVLAGASATGGVS